MANHKATGKKAGKGPELVQYVRQILLGAFEVSDQKGVRITEVLAKELEANPLKFLEVASKYCPKEVAMELEATVTHFAAELTDDELANIATGSSAGTVATPESAPDPAAVH